MTTTVSVDNTVKIPDAIARLMGWMPGSALHLQVADDGTLLVHMHRSRGERADRLLGIGQPFLEPGEDPVAELVKDRSQDASGVLNASTRSPILPPCTRQQS